MVCQGKGDFHWWKLALKIDSLSIWRWHNGGILWLKGLFSAAALQPKANKPLRCDAIDFWPKIVNTSLGWPFRKNRTFMYKNIGPLCKGHFLVILLLRPAEGETIIKYSVAAVGFFGQNWIAFAAKIATIYRLDGKRIAIYCNCWGEFIEFSIKFWNISVLVL